MKWKIQFGYFLLAVLLFWCVQSQSLAHAEYEYPQPVYGVWMKYEVELTTKPKLVVNKIVNKGYNPCSCVSFIKYRTGYTASVGNARNWPINATEPQVGAVVVMDGKNHDGTHTGHVALITAVSGDTLTIEDTNYKKCQYTKRVINTNDPLILGYWINNL